MMQNLLDDPNDVGMMSLGLRLLSTPGKFGQALGTAGLGAMGDMQQQKQVQAQRQMQAAQMANIKQQEALRQQQVLREIQKQQMLERLLGGAPQAQQPAMGGGQATGGQIVGAGAQGGGQVSQASQLSGLNEDQIIGAIALGLPPKAYDAWKFAKVGETAPAGGYQLMPDGRKVFNADPTKGVTIGKDGSVQMMPGAAQAQAAMAGATAGATTAAQEEARAPYTFVDAYVNGQPGKVQLSSLVQKQPATRGQMASDLASPDTRFSSPAVRAAVERAAGVRPGFMPTGPSQTDKAAAEANSDVNKDWFGTSYKPVLDAGNAAKGVLTSIGVARTGLSMAGLTGWGKEAQVMGARVLGALGVDKADQLASGAQIFQQAASTRLWETLNNAKGPQTEGDAQRAQDTFAKLGNTVRANMFILDLAQANAERDQRKAAWYRDALPIGQKAGDLQMLDRKWAEREPSVWTMPSMQKWGK